MSVNQVILTGNLGQDPTLRFTKEKNPVANFSLATHFSTLDEGGEKQETTTWVNVQVWGKRAETCKEYLKKGYHICLQGRLTNNTWTDQEGNQRIRTEVVAHSWEVLHKPIQEDMTEGPQMVHPQQ